MSRWRVLVVVGLIVVPVLVLAGVGSYFLWSQGWAFWAWWPMMGSIAAGYLLALYWQRKRQLLRPPGFEVQPHWTDRDRGAWKLVEARAQAAAGLAPEKLSEVPFYLQTAQEMARELAAYYHPGAADPLSSLTVPEVLAVVELASHDLGDLVEKNLPGGHLLTIRDWQRARQLTKYYQVGSNIYWAVAAVFNPLETGARYLAARAGLGEPMKLLQQNLFLWFYTAFVHRVGTYLIDVNSGRLRVGATRYRELVESIGRDAQRQGEVMEPVAAGPFPHEKEPLPDEQVRQVTVTLVGQVKAGKSSLVNALLGEERAKTGALPTTAEVQRYEVVSPGLPSKLVLNDTVGYGHSGPRADQVSSTAEAAKQSDLLFLVLHARNPARQADVDMVTKLREWFAARPDLKMPPVIAVVTHIDLLSPAMEWAPPYDYLRGERPKERNIREALGAARGQFPEALVAVVPACVTSGKVYGVDEWLVPAVTAQLDELRGVALLRVLKAEADRDRLLRVWHQAAAAGQEALRIAGQLLWPSGGR